MDGALVPLFFFGFLACVIFGPRYLRFKERERVLEMIRLAIERGQTPPQDLLDALKFDAYRGGRRRAWADYPPYYGAGYGPNTGWERGPAAGPPPPPAGQPSPPPEPSPIDPGLAGAPAAGPSPSPSLGPTPGWTETGKWERDENRRAIEALRYGPDRDLRRGVILVGVGLGFVAIGAAFYAGLYNVGGATETFATFSAIGAIPGFIGLAYIALWSFTRKATKL